MFIETIVSATTDVLLSWNFCHCTSILVVPLPIPGSRNGFVQDTKATQAVLAGVRDGILRLHLEELNVIWAWSALRLSVGICSLSLVSYHVMSLSSASIWADPVLFIYERHDLVFSSA
jgi:hypothetical protein